MDSLYSVFLVDDHPLVIDGILGYLEGDNQYEVKGTANNGKEALQKLSDLDVDVVFTDINMPVMDGVELSRKLLSQNPSQKIIALSMYGEAQQIKKMLQVGVMGYVLKNSTKSQIQKAIEAVASGGQFYSPEVTHVIMNKLRGNMEEELAPVQLDLTSREREILYHILNQNSNQEIAEKLFISTRTVEAHKRNLLEKTGSKNVAGLVLYALDNHIFEEF